MKRPVLKDFIKRSVLNELYNLDISTEWKQRLKQWASKDPFSEHIELSTKQIKHMFKDAPYANDSEKVLKILNREFPDFFIFLVSLKDKDGVDNNNGVKISLPDPYAGELNTKRIRAYTKLQERYNIDISSVRDIFDEGLDWYKKEIENQKL